MRVISFLKWFSLWSLRSELSKCKICYVICCYNEENLRMQVHGREMISFSSLCVVFFSEHFIFLLLRFVCLFGSLHVYVIQKTTFWLLFYFARAMCNFIVGLSHIFDRAPHCSVRNNRAEWVRACIFFALFCLAFFWSCTVFGRHKSTTCDLRANKIKLYRKERVHNIHAVIKRQRRRDRPSEWFCAFHMFA